MKKVKNLISVVLVAVMLMGMLPVVRVFAATSELSLTGYGQSGNSSGEGIMVATGVRPSSTGTADKAPYVAGETASFITNLASTRIGVMAFGIQNADADSFEAATLNVYVNGVNGNIGKGWTKFAVYETLNPTLTYKTGGMNQSDFAAVNNDYSYDAAMWSNEHFTNSGSNGETAGWATVDVTEAVKNAINDGKSQVVLRFQVPSCGLNLSVEGEYAPYITLANGADATAKAGDRAYDINSMGYVAVNSKNLIDKSLFDYTCNSYTGWTSGGSALGDNFSIGEGYNDDSAIYAAELGSSTGAGSINPYIPLPEHSGEETFILSFALHGASDASIEWSNAFLCDENKNRTNYIMGNYNGNECKYAVRVSDEWAINRVAFTPSGSDKYVRLCIGWTSDIGIDNISIVKAKELMVEVEERYIINSTAYDDEPEVIGYGDDNVNLQYGEQYVSDIVEESLFYNGEEYVLISDVEEKFINEASGEKDGKIVFDYRYVRYDDMFLHPGLLNTAADLERIARAVANGEEPYVSGYEALCANSYAQLGTHRAVGTISRGGSGDNCALLYRDAHRAYLCAIRWKISGDTAYADCARDILNGWSGVLKTVTGNADRYLAAGLYGYELACAAEIMRDYEGFELERMQDMLINVFYKPLNERFLYSNEYGGDHNGAHIMNYWANWDLCNMAAAAAIGVFCDRRDIYERALEYYKNGAGNGSIFNAVPKLYEASSDTMNVPVGQWQEAGRDMEHTQMGVGLMAVTCEIAWNQGDDIYSWAGNRFLAGAEYVAQHHLGNSMPYTTYNWYTGQGSWSSQSGITGAASGIRPVFEMIYNHYNKRKGMETPGMEALLETVRPEGGASSHGSSFDQFGFGTLLYTRNAGSGTKAEIPPSNVEEGTYIITSKRSGKALTQDTDGYIRQYTADENNERQLWRLTDLGGGIYTLTNKATGKVMSIENNSYDLGAMLTTGDYKGKYAQQFAFMCFDDEWDNYYAGGYYRITPVGSGLSLDVRDGSYDDGADVLQYTYNRGSWQQWELTWVECEYELADEIADVEVISGNEPVMPEKITLIDESGNEITATASWDMDGLDFTNDSFGVKTVTVTGCVAGIDISVDVKIYPETFALEDIYSKNSQKDADANLVKFPVAATDEFVIEMNVCWNDFGDQWIMLKDSSNANYFGPDQIEVGFNKSGDFRPVDGNGTGGRNTADTTLATLSANTVYRVFIKGNAAEDKYTVTLSTPDGEVMRAEDYGFRSNADCIDSVILFANTGSYNGAFYATDIKGYFATYSDSENAVIADTFATADAAVSDNASEMLFAASSGVSDADDVDADGNMTVTGDGWNLGNPRIPLLTFNVPEEYHDGMAVKLNVYVAKVHTHLKKNNTMKLAAGIVDFTVDEKTGYSTDDVADLENIVWSDNAIGYSDNAGTVNQWVTIDVTEFVQSAEGKVTFALYAPKAAAYIVDRESAATGSEYEGLAAYLEVVEGETITTSGMEKVTKNGTAVQNAEYFTVPCGTTLKFYNQTAVAVSDGSNLYYLTDGVTDDVEARAGEYYAVEPVYSTGEFEALEYDAITKGSIDMLLMPYEVTDNVVGITASDSNPTWYDQFNIVVRFKPDGTMDAYNGTVIESYEAVSYEAGKMYYLHIETDVENGTYSAWITDENGVEYTLALDYAYRASAPEASDLGKVTLIGGWGVGGGKFAAADIRFSE